MPEEHLMMNAVFDAIPSPEAMEYDGELPSAFGRLPAFSPHLEELRTLRPEPAPQRTRLPVYEQPPVVKLRVVEPKPAKVPPRLDPKDLERFEMLMAAERWPVRVPRMLMDRKYACDRIVLAYTSANQELLSLAQHLFAVFQARTDAPSP
jgi:hypothetical protein